MTQITLSIPNEKIPVLHEFLQNNGIENKYVSNLFQKARNIHSTISVNDMLAEQIGWENYRNELEFE